MSAKVTSSTARKVIGSLGVGAAYRHGHLRFLHRQHDRSEHDDRLRHGQGRAQATVVPFTATGLVPGDSVTRTFTLKNAGTTDFGSLSLESLPTNSPQSVLTTDAVNGLQLAVKSCAVAWTPERERLLLLEREKTLLTDPAAVTKPLTSPASLTAGQSDNIAITTLPTTAGNAFRTRALP